MAFTFKLEHPDGTPADPLPGDLNDMGDRSTRDRRESLIFK